MKFVEMAPSFAWSPLACTRFMGYAATSGWGATNRFRIADLIDFSTANQSLDGRRWPTEIKLFLAVRHNRRRRRRRRRRSTLPNTKSNEKLILVFNRFAFGRSVCFDECRGYYERRPRQRRSQTISATHGANKRRVFHFVGTECSGRLAQIEA